MRRLHTPTRMVWFACLLAAPLLGGGGSAHAAIDARIEQVIRAAELKDTKVSVMVVDVARRQALAEVNADEPMMPASNMKIITAAGAMDTLGPDFVFRTRLRLASLDEQGGGVLVVEGDGDPAFADPKLLEAAELDFESLVALWVKAASDAGVTRVTKLIVDDRVFDREFIHESWPADQLNQWYCAQVAGINLNDNCIDVLPIPTSAGQSPRVRLMPEAPFIAETNRAVTGPADTFWISRKMGTNELTYWGKVKTPRTSPYWVTLHDPPVFFGQVFADRLRRSGIEVGPVARAAAGDDFSQAKVLHVVQTPLWAVVRRCNKDSQNLFAEALLKRMGHEATGAPGGWLNGAAAVRMFLQKRVGQAASAVNVADGSGLSRDNRVTARLLAELLASMHRDAELRDVEGKPLFIQTLAAAGEDGTLRRRMKGLSGRVFAKTGFINGVSTLSGYLVIPGAEGKPDRTMAFSLLFNQIKPPVYLHRVQALQEELVELIDESLMPKSAVPGG